MSIHIETPRLIIRTPVIDDAQMIADAMKPVWHDLQLWMSWSFDGANQPDAIRKNFIAPAIEAKHMIGLCKESGAFIISTGMTPHKDIPGQHETGYWVAKDFLGKGYATEATNAAIRYGFNAMNVRKVYISHYEGNGPSHRVIEKLGFTKTGIRATKHARCLDGMPLDVHEYEMCDPAVLPALDVRW